MSSTLRGAARVLLVGLACCTSGTKCRSDMHDSHIQMVDHAARPGGPPGQPAAPAKAASVRPGDNVGSTTVPLMVNLGFDCYYCQTPVFVDLMKAGEPWRYGWTPAGGYASDKFTLDANDWPTAIASGDVARSCLGSPHRLGRYVVKWKGQGQFSIASYDGTSSPFSVETTAAGQSELTVTKAGMLCVEIRSTQASDPLRDISIVHESLAEAAETQPFYPEMLGFLHDFAGIRFMDWLSTNDSKQSNWSDRPGPDRRVVRNNLEYAIRLLNTMKRDGWFNVPHLATDDYVTKMAELLRDRVNPRLKIFIEYSNETWNGMFHQNAYCMQQGEAQDLAGADAHEKGFRFHAKRSLEVFKIFEKVFAGQLDRLVRVVAGQTGNTWMAGVHLKYGDLAKHMDGYAVAPYFGYHSIDDFGGQAASWNLDQLFSRLTTDDLPAALKSMQTMSEFLERFGISMLAYEGGQHLTNNQKGAATDLYVAANRDSRMGNLYATYLAGWKSAGGHAFALYSAVGPYGRFGSWGLRESLDQPRTAAPKYDAVLTFMANNPRWW